MFYEDERIIRKNEKYEFIKAKSILNDLQKKGLTQHEVLDAVQVMESEVGITEFKQAVLKKVKRLNH